MDMEETLVKRATPDKVAQLGALSDRVFRPQIVPGTAMAHEFPLLFHARNAEHLYYVEDGGRPVALVGMAPGGVATCGTRVSAVSMGSVCTDSAYRQRHYASTMIEQVLADYTPDTSVLFVSGGLSIYRRVGCVNFGSFASVWLESSPGVGPDAGLRTPIVARLARSEADFAALHALYIAEPLRFARTPEQMTALLGALDAPMYRDIPCTPRVFVAEQGGRVIAYAVVNVADRDDAPAHFIEWAGARNALFALAQAAREAFSVRAARLYLAKEDATARALFRAAGVTMEERANQGTVRVLNPQLLLQEIGPALLDRYGEVPVLEDTGQDEWTVRFARRSPAADALQGAVLRGYGALSAWFFGAGGLQWPLPRTDDLNYI